MFHMYIFWKWTTLLFVSRIALEQSSNTVPVVTVLDVLAFLFFVVGIVVLLLMRPWQRTSSKARLASSQISRGQLRGMSVALPTFLAVPVIVLLLVWLGASTLSPVSSTRSSPTVYISVVPAHSTTTQNPLSAAIAHDLVTPGVLTVGTDTSYPPQTFIDSHNKPAGSDIDIITAIAQKLGLKPAFVQMPYQNLASNLENHQFDVVISAYALKDVKKGENFVSYLNPADVLLVPKNNTGNLQFTKFTDLCGHNISVLQGSSEDAVLKQKLGDCAKNKPSPLPPINVIEKQDIKSVIDAVVNKTPEADAAYLDDPTANYYFNNNYKGKVEILGSMPGAQEVILIRQGDAAMAIAIQSAFNLVVLDQTYSKLLSKWNLTNDQLPGTA